MSQFGHRECVGCSWQYKSARQQKYLIINIIKPMNGQYKTLITNQHLPGRPVAAYDVLKRTLVHIYENLTLEPAQLQKEVERYLSRKESYSGHVVVITKIKDQRITYHMGKASMEVSVVTDYVPWRLHLQTQKLSLELALAILYGSCKGFRELLHRVRFPFPIQGSMVGMDENGEVKVWWNELFERSGFGFTMTANIKLKDMVRSLFEAVMEKTEVAQVYRLQALLSNHFETFATLQQRIQEVSIGIDFKDVGRRLVMNEQAHITAINLCQDLGNSRESLLMQMSRSSNQLVRPNFSSQKVILSSRKAEPLTFNQKIIIKRTYHDGTSPQNHEKLKIIKDDIQKLRSVVDKNEPIESNLQSRLRSSRSVESLFSYRKGLSGNTKIPEIKKIIQEAQIMDKPQNIEISRFVDPQAESSTSILHNPESLSQQQQYHSNSLFLSKLKNICGQENALNLTPRSIKMGTFVSTQASKQYIPESQRRIPQNMYSISTFEQ